MKKFLLLIVLLTLGSFTSSFAQDGVWSYKVTSVRYGTGSDGIASHKSNVRWGEWTGCELSVKIDLDNKNLIVTKGEKAEHSIAFSILDVNTDSNPANVLMAGFDVCRMDIASADWYLYKGQSHHLFLFYEGDVAIEYLMTVL